MSIAPRIQQHLSRIGVDYSLISHPKSESSADSARFAHIPAEQVAKGVMTYSVGDTGEKNYRLCVIPSSHRLVIHWLNRHLNGDYHLVKENELPRLFEDCDEGAVPALGQVYGLPVIWDLKLMDLGDIYFESGDHLNLVHLDHGSFLQLMGLQDHAMISCPEEDYDRRSELIH